MTRIPESRDDCLVLDRQDPLLAARAAFSMPDGAIYLCGHSLGPPPASSLESLDKAARQEWAQGLVRSWNMAGWFDLCTTLGAKIAALTGVKAEEILIAESVSTNLFKLAAAALPLAGSRTIVVEEDDFPTDQYIAEGLSRTAGARFERAGQGEGLDLACQNGGVLIKSAVNYRSAAVTDMAAEEEKAASHGAIIVWDLSHAAGVLDLDLSAVRLAVGCTYKYLNGGPGAPAFLYARSDIVDRMETPLPGWMGHAAPFAFSPDYVPAEGVQRFANGTPPILSVSALAGALQAFEGVNPADLEAKARALGDLCLTRAGAMGLSSPCPGIGARRGGHITLLHQEGYAIIRALLARNIIGDFRAPDAMRFGFSPLFVTHTQVWDAMDALEDILATEEWDQPAFRARAKVT